MAGWRRRSIASLLVLLAAASSGCAYRYAFVTELAPATERVSEWRHIGLWGWVSDEPFDLGKACPTGVSEFGSYVSFLNWLPTLVTAGIYAPRTVYAHCAVEESAR